MKGKDMEYFFRRKRVLKTLISLILAFGTLLMFQKLKLVENNSKENLMKSKDAAGFLDVQSDLFRSALGNNSPPGLGEKFAADRASVSNATQAEWDVKTINCSENVDLKEKEWFQRLEPRFHQFVLHRHCRYFPMLINHPEKCRTGDLHLLMVVKSVIEQHDRREAVRRTWGKERTIDGKIIKTLFLLGTPSAGKDTRNLQKLIDYEDRLYGDILQWDFIDTFFNLTLKEVNFLKWFDIYCSRVKFIFKGDDDVFVNTNNLMDLIDFKTEERKVRNLFVGDTISKAIPIRNRQSKYYIPRELFDRPYPPYVGGGGFVMSGQLARRLFAVSEDLELYPIDDVFLGMCLQRLHLAPEMHAGFRTFGIMKRQVSPMNSDPCFYRNLIVIHKLGPQELLRMWNIVYNKKLICAKKVIL
ncbi:UDP-GlcNAc:betaGal beta-1,3-N-acetylglucosaminyltransferase 7, like [Brienomyrus brachyistius]|uniref:UDP-GlcNAc:betaGal beta-1,3-N-acetylglucosaminyltransferase 7, like n=1 Tax=Brienomyrus brachyistius TaxID=42636 RepID=UPI0020B447DD|nr:UDP-GlcNAc:betaGal beta-1,3-N-acetylglucosaminyltransferase 7, like [Brienomyrus brachyistius]